MSYYQIILDRSREKLTEVPEEVLRMSNLKMLYLEGNMIEFLPAFFFEQLPKLTWLDLRSNGLKELPPSIGLHENLENLLLTDNKIKSLPNELGLVPKLRSLQIAYNPLEYPPPEVVESGTSAIMSFLHHQYGGEKKTTAFEEKVMKMVDASSNDSIKVHVGSTTEVLQKTPSGPTFCVAGRKSFSNVKHKMAKSRSKISVRSSCHTHLVTREKVEMAHLREEFLSKIREMLMEQEKILQQEKNLKALENWRKDEKIPRVQEKKPPAEPPYGTYPQYNKMPTREELFKQIDRYIESSQKTSEIDIDKVIKDLTNLLKNMQKTDLKDGQSSAAHLMSVSRELNAIKNIHKTLIALQGKNNNMH